MILSQGQPRVPDAASSKDHMLKTIFWILLLISVISLLRRHQTKEPSTSWHWGSDTLVIKFTDGEDLLAQLQKVKTGQKIEIRHVGPSQAPVSTGISCSDEAAKAAYMRDVEPIRQAEMARLNHALDVEFRRIQQVPPDLQ